MGYACPVCEEPQIDARHLANHLAFLAMLGREEHEAWLAEHAPGWEEGGERELAARVRELADDAEYPQVFEDTTGRLDSEHGDDTERSGKLFEDDHAHGHEHDFSQGRPSAVVDEGNLTPEQQEIFAEAQALTREMLKEDEERADADEDTASDETGECDE